MPGLAIRIQPHHMPGDIGKTDSAVGKAAVEDTVEDTDCIDNTEDGDNPDGTARIAGGHIRNYQTWENWHDAQILSYGPKIDQYPPGHMTPYDHPWGRVRGDALRPREAGE